MGDLAVGTILCDWGLGALVSIFQSNEIDTEAFNLLDNDTIKVLIPQLGPRLKFMQQFHKWKKETEERREHETLSQQLDLLSETLSVTESFTHPYSDVDISPVSDVSTASTLEVLNPEEPSCSKTVIGGHTVTPDNSAQEEFVPPPLKKQRASYGLDLTTSASTDRDIACSQTAIRVSNSGQEDLASPQLKRQLAVAAYDFDVRAIMHQTEKGKRAVQEITNLKACTPKNTHILTNMCVDFLVSQHGLRPGSDVKEAMALAVIRAFPFLRDPEGQGHEEWFIKGKGKRPSSGRFENRLKYVRRISSPRPTVQEDDPSSSEDLEQKKTMEPSYDIEEMKNATECLKSNNFPQETVAQKMKQTTFFRKAFIHSKDNPSVAEIAAEFPHLFNTGMIEQDYDTMYPGKGNLLLEKWPLMSACVLEFATHVYKDWKTRFHVEGKRDHDFTGEEKQNLAFAVLSALFEGRKKKGGRASAKETLDLFIDFQKEGTSVDVLRKSHVEKSQPYVLAIGGSYSQPRQCLVIVEDKVLACADLLNAVSRCYKVYQVLDLQYPSQAENVWGFFDSMIFNANHPNPAGSVRRFRAYYNFNSC